MDNRYWELKLRRRVLDYMFGKSGSSKYNEGKE